LFSLVPRSSFIEKKEEEEEEHSKLSSLFLVLLPGVFETRRS